MSWKLLRAIIASGWSGLTYLITGVPDSKVGVFNNYWGLFSSEMKPHWERVETPGETFHDYKNITTEWCRAYAQPASKALSALILIGGLGWICWAGFGIYQLISIVINIYLGEGL